MATNNKHLFNNPRFSDLIVRYADKELRLHRNIVCLGAQFSDRECDGRNTLIKIIKLDEVDTDTMHRMFYYFYALDYSDGSLEPFQPQPSTTLPSSNSANLPVLANSVLNTKAEPETPTTEYCHSSTPSEKLLVNALVYTMADKYEASGLKELARKKFETNAFLEWPISGFPLLLHGIYDTTPETDTGLRNVISEVCALHLDDIMADKAISNLGMLYPEFASGILRHIHDMVASKSQALQNEKFHSETASKAHAQAVIQIQHLQKAYNATREELSATQRNFQQANPTLDSVKANPAATSKKLARCEDLLKKMHGRAVNAEADLEDFRQKLHRVHRNYDKEKVKVAELQQQIANGSGPVTKIGNHTVTLGSSVGTNGGSGIRSADWLIDAVANFSPHGCVDCKSDMDSFVRQGRRVAMRCSSCHSLHFLS